MRSTPLWIMFVFLFVTTAFAQDHSLPGNLEVITAQNAGRLDVLETLSEGVPSSLTWSPDSQQIAVTSQVGTWLYQVAQPELRPERVEGHLSAPTITYGPRGDVYISIDCPYWTCPGQRALIHDARTSVVLGELHGSELDLPQFSSDGTWFALSESSGRIRLWRTTDLLRSKDPDNAFVCSFQTSPAIGSLVLSPDSKLLASTVGGTGNTMQSDDDAVYLWNTSTCQQQAALQGHTRYPIAVAFSPSDQYLTTYQTDDSTDTKQYSVWDLKTGEAVLSLMPADNLQFSPDSSTLLITLSTEIRLLHLQSNQQEDYPSSTAAVYRSSGTLLLGQRDGEIEAITGTSETTFHPGSAAIAWLRLSDNQRWLLSYDHNQVLTLSDVPAMKVIQQWQMPVQLAALSPNGERVAWVNSETGQLFLWDTAAMQETPLNDFQFVGADLYLSSDGKRLISSSPSQLRAWNISDQISSPYALHLPIPAEFTVRDDTILSKSDDGLRLWDASTGKQRLFIQQPNCRIPALSEHSRYVACSLQDWKTSAEEVDVWDAQTGERLLSIPTFGLQLLFNEDQGTLIIGGRRDTGVWNIETQEEIEHYSKTGNLSVDAQGDVLLSTDTEVDDLTDDKTLLKMPLIQAGTQTYPGCPDDGRTCEPGQTYDVPYYYDDGWTQLSPDRTTIFSWGTAVEDSFAPLLLRLWNIPTQAELLHQEDQDIEIRLVTFSPDGTLLAVGYDDYWQFGSLRLNRTVDIFDTRTGQRIATLPTYAWPAQSIVFSPDSRLIFVDSDTVRVWGVQGHTS